MIKKNKKTISRLGLISTFLSIIVLLFSGCSTKDSKNGTTICCTIFPIYDWVSEACAGCDDIEVILLEDTGADMHSFQPAVKDLVTIDDCDIFIYVGGESENWAKEYVEKNPGKNGRVNINLMDAIKDDVLVESDEGIVGGLEEEEEEEENDEHIWLSLKRSEKCVNIIADEIIKKAPDDTDKITSNVLTYTNKLEDLDKEYSDYFSSANRTLVIADRFPFRYLAEDYNIIYIAALPGCSAEAYSSFDMILSLAKEYAATDESVMYITESGDEEFAQNVISESGKNGSIKVIDSIQSVSRDAINNGASYYDYMKKNLEVISSN